LVQPTFTAHDEENEVTYK